LRLVGRLLLSAYILNEEVFLMRRLLTGFTAVPFLAFAVVPASAQSTEPAPVASLVKKVDIPYEAFTLANGLRVFIMIPIARRRSWRCRSGTMSGRSMSPRARRAFAHLFEHLMFNGSENSPGDFFEPLQQVGATDSQRHDLVRSHQLFRDGADSRAGPRIVPGIRSHGSSARRGDAGEAR
jgi:hypothetical protein